LFTHYDRNLDKVKNDLCRFLDLIFGKPYATPTFDEFAMFMAFASALRSADLSRQVEAIIAHDNEILSTGAKDTPWFSGGLYWPQYNNRGSR
jgi:deoxycytidylate deaminase